MTDYEWLDELYEDQPKVQKIQRSQAPVNEHHDLLRRTENAKNRHAKARAAKAFLRGEEL